MRYLITRATSGAVGEVVLTREEFERIRAAKAGAFLALKIEERFGIFRENYREYEREIFEIAQREVLYAEYKWAEHVADIYAVNRRLLNLLAAARLCRHQLSADLCGQEVDSATRQEVRMVRERQTADSWIFDFMEKTRDIIQHNLLPVSQGGRKTSSDERPSGIRLLRHTAEPRISLRVLLDAKQISGDLFDRVKPHATRDDLLELNPMVREYVQLQGKIHKSVREALAPRVAAWDTVYLDAIERGTAATGSKFALSLACEYEDEDDELAIEKPPKSEDLFADLVDQRKYLEVRVGRAHMLPSAQDYISTE